MDAHFFISLQKQSSTVNKEQITLQEISMRKKPHQSGIPWYDEDYDPFQDMTLYRHFLKNADKQDLGRCGEDTFQNHSDCNENTVMENGNTTDISASSQEGGKDNQPNNCFTNESTSVLFDSNNSNKNSNSLQISLSMGSSMEITGVKSSQSVEAQCQNSCGVNECLGSKGDEGEEKTPDVLLLTQMKES